MPISAFLGTDGIAAGYPINDEQYKRALDEEADTAMQKVLDMATQASIKSEGIGASEENIAQAIVDVAKEHNCDLIYIGSHGRSGLSRLLLGSVTSKVLSPASTSVLVYETSEIAQ